MVKYNNLTKAEILMTLFNRAKTKQNSPMELFLKNLSLSEAQVLVSQSLVFNCLYGRELYVDLTKDYSFDETGYDSINGKGAAQNAIDTMVIDKIEQSYYNSNF